jgi:hypothetical protein
MIKAVFVGSVLNDATIILCCIDSDIKIACFVLLYFLG